MDPSVQHNDARFLELLQRWQSGDFTRADEQELNTLAASDDFRREAMEGFMSLPETRHDERLAALRSRLYKQPTGGRRIAMPQMWAAAAVLLVLIAVVVFFPQWNAKDTAPLAQTQTESYGENPANQANQATEPSDNQYITGKSPAMKPAPRGSGSSGAPPGNEALSAPDAAGTAIASEEIEAAAADDNPSEYVIAPPQAPNAAPVIQSQKALDKIASATHKDRAVESVANRPGDNAKAKKSKQPGQDADSVWHSTDLKPDMEAEKKAAREEKQALASEPEGGWEAFSEYLRLNARLTPEARNNNASGTVRLQFNINSNGDPLGFVVLRSVGYGCDQEAIRLVQGWEWVRGINPIVVVEVPFVR